MELISHYNVKLNDGFWKQKENLNKEVTINAVYDRFYDTGRINAFSCSWKEGEPHKPHVFWDSDVAKWIEGASYILANEPNKDLETKIESIIDNIEKNMDEKGYFNVYFLIVEPQNRFTNRDAHELYCAGHLIEAAIAYHIATGKDRFLRLMEKYVDYIYEVFVVEDSATFVTPGHEEIEIALLKLYYHTNNKKYFDLASFFLEQRGANEKESDNSIYKQSHISVYRQSHAPIREQFTAIGHAVRAGYLYSAMADYAADINDSVLKNTCKALFEDISNKKMYITGSVGSTYVGESFTIPYDLPNFEAYTETCAAISMMFFANRMLRLENDAKYADMVERAMYNGMLSGVSLDGKGFFYENPLEINLQRFSRNVSTSEKQRYPITQRVEVFGCSCCPPNINRVLSSMGSYVYGFSDNTLYINQFMSSTLEYKGIKALMETNYPNDETVKIQATGVEKVAIRIPSWAKDYTFSKSFEILNGYAVFENVGEPITAIFKMTPKLIQANALVWDDSGKVALTRGPVVYCLEGVDNPNKLHTLYIKADTEYTTEYSDMFGLPTITADGYTKKVSEELYQEYRNDDFEEIKLNFIPYNAFANRGSSDMLVYINVK